MAGPIQALGVICDQTMDGLTWGIEWYKSSDQSLDEPRKCTVSSVQPSQLFTQRDQALALLRQRGLARMSELKAQGIQCSALHQRNDVYSGFGIKPSQLPGTAHAMERLLAVPCGWWLNDKQLKRISDAIRLEKMKLAT